MRRLTVRQGTEFRFQFRQFLPLLRQGVLAGRVQRLAPRLHGLHRHATEAHAGTQFLVLGVQVGAGTQQGRVIARDVRQLPGHVLQFQRLYPRLHLGLRGRVRRTLGRNDALHHAALQALAQLEGDVAGAFHLARQQGTLPLRLVDLPDQALQAAHVAAPHALHAREGGLQLGQILPLLRQPFRQAAFHLLDQAAALLHQRVHVAPGGRFRAGNAQDAAQALRFRPVEVQVEFPGAFLELGHRVVRQAKLGGGHGHGFGDAVNFLQHFDDAFFGQHRRYGVLKAAVDVLFQDVFQRVRVQRVQHQAA